jgi:hypothetical protein
MSITHISTNDIQQYWKTGGLALENLRTPASITQLHELARATGEQIPTEFKELYLFADGFKEGCRDEQGFRFWPLEEIVSVEVFENGEHRFNGANAFYLFCDYFEFSWGYAFKVASTSSLEIYMIGTKSMEPVLVASSFAEFLRLYVLNDVCLYPK